MGSNWWTTLIPEFQLKDITNQRGSSFLIPKSKSLLVGAVYCPPVPSNFLHPQFNAEIKESFDNAIVEEKEVIILGLLEC